MKTSLLVNLITNPPQEMLNELTLLTSADDFVIGERYGFDRPTMEAALVHPVFVGKLKATAAALEKDGQLQQALARNAWMNFLPVVDSRMNNTDTAPKDQLEYLKYLGNVGGIQEKGQQAIGNAQFVINIIPPAGYAPEQKAVTIEAKATAIDITPSADTMAALNSDLAYDGA